MYTRVTGPNFTHCLKKDVITVGRRSQLPIDICLGDSVCISRKHLELHTIDGALFLRILGKNGIFIDEEFQMISDDLIPLPNCCRLRFPSTPITLVVEILDSNSNSRHPKKRTIWRYSAELAGLTDYAGDVSEFSEEKRKKLLPPVGEGEVSADLERKSNSQPFNTLITESIANPVAPSQCKSDSTEPFSTPEPASPPEPPLPTPSHTKSRRPDVELAAAEQPTSLRFPNLLAAYSRSPPKDAATRSRSPNATENSTAVSGPAGQGAALSPCATGTPPPSTAAAGEEAVCGRAGAADAVDHGTVHEKPPYSYAQLIVQAIVSAPNRRLTLSDIYNYISTQFPYYKPSQKGWQNSIRHNLSLNRYFIRIPRGQEEPGKGAFWRLDPESEAHLAVKAFQKRRQRSYVVPAYVASGTSPQRTSGLAASADATAIATATNTSAAGAVESPSNFREGTAAASGLEFASALFDYRDPVSASATSHSHAEAADAPLFLPKEPVSSGLPLFKSPAAALFVHDDSILASSLLLAGNSIISGTSETSCTSTSTPSTASQLYSQFENYYHLHENGLLPSSFLPPHPAAVSASHCTATTATATTKSAGGCGEGYTSQMPNLAASLLRNRSGSLNRRASEPDLQKLPAADNFNAAAAAAAAATAAVVAASANVNGNVTLEQKSTTEQLVRALRGNLLLDMDYPVSTASNVVTPNCAARPLIQMSSKAELYTSPMREFPHAYDDLDGDESTMFVQENNNNSSSSNNNNANSNNRSGNSGSSVPTTNGAATAMAMTSS